MCQLYAESWGNKVEQGLMPYIFNIYISFV